jgi:tRNA threonylcarbamoyl adenosine modification protein YeaZ
VSALADGLLLAVDTSTRSSVVVIGRGEPLAVSRRDVRHRHGSHVLEQIDAVLKDAGASLEDVVGLAVGTGPGSFTGLRVGMATVKTIAYTRRTPLVGVVSCDCLRRAAVDSGGSPDTAVVLPAGARDHYLAAPGIDPVLIAPGDLLMAIDGRPVLTIDMEADLLGKAATELGHAALEGMPDALLAMARERLEAGDADDVAELVPAYVALPRGVKRAAEDLGWSPDLQ